ncbi:MAG: TPM domain-containing protein [Arcobacteraceae bacterium]
MKKLLWLFLALNIFAKDVPQLTSSVEDLAHLFTQEQKQKLESKLERIEQASSSQIAILSILSLEDEDLSEYAIKVAQSWKLGKKSMDNGILILIVKESHDIRIEVGYGLEGQLPDGLAGSIIRNAMIPHFKNGNFYEGVSLAITQIDEAVHENPIRNSEDTKNLLPNKPTQNSSAQNKDFEPGLGLFIILFAVLGIISKRNKLIGATAGSIGFTLLSFLFVTQSILILLLIAITGAILGYSAAFLQKSLHGSKTNKDPFSNSKIPKDIFRGGGGKFGGGGSSGRW